MKSFLGYVTNKIVLRDVLATPVMVHKSLDPCRGEYLWYKGYTNF